ncbi:MAG: YicC family protein [Clostridia bacterium]|nr:YicC family protein [Clostridia bacterium]
MTGFGKGVAVENGVTITVEIKTVNHKFFEYQSRMPRSFQFLDEKLKSFLATSISRGKTEVSVFVEDTSDGSVQIDVNKAYAEAYIKALKQVAKEYKLKDDIKASSLIGNGDIFIGKKRDIPEDIALSLTLAAAKGAVQNLLSMREAEGERLKDDVLSRTDYILSLVQKIEERSPLTVKEYEQRLKEKVQELLGDKTVDEQRLITEVAIFADKVAVAEETVRLRSHIKAVSELMETETPKGRKLDFLVQEMNRETNTIGSKAQDIEIAHIVVDIKSEIEKIREQIQNIE